MDISLKTIAIAVAGGGGVAVLVEVYLIARRWVRNYLFDEWDLAARGVTERGELTTGAKYAIWNYMFSILAVGGTIIGVMAGVAGYMINDLAKKEAIQTALDKMQTPLAKQLEKLADARAGLEIAAGKVTTDEFAMKIATKLSSEANFHKDVAGVLGDAGGFQKSVADALFFNYRDKLRGDPGPAGSMGPPGQNGTNGVNGASPTAESVATQLGADGTFANKIADALLSRYGKQLRGDPGAPGPMGPPGPPGRDGKNGVNGTNPSVAEVAKLLASSYRDQLRGEKGPPGKDGQNGTSPSAEEVARILSAQYGVQVQPKLTPSPQPRVRKRRGHR